MEKKYRQFCKARTKAIEESRQKYVALFKDESTKTQEINKLLSSLTKISLERRKLISKIYALKTQPEIKRDRSAEWTSLMKTPKVVSVQIGENLSVTTDMIYIQHRDTKKWHKIGKFRISIPILSDEDDYICSENIYIENIDNHFSESSLEEEEEEGGGFAFGVMQHPHVFEGGDICFGNAERAVDELLQRGEYTALIQLIITFLQHANVDDEAGESLRFWPVVTAEEAKGRKARHIAA